jgi:hypothetical protein
MNLSIFWRVFWKEYRLQRPLWLVVAALAVLAGLLTFACSLHPFFTTVTLHYIALVTPALYALGCGATLFAGEHEAETYEFQRSLPARASSLLIGKVVFAVFSTAAMLGLMQLLVLLWAPLPPAAPSVPWRALAWATIGFYTVEVFVWAVFFSLLTKRVLVAAVLGVSAASIGSHLAAATITWNVMMETYAQAMPWRLGIVAVVALADVWLAAQWFREKRDRQPRVVQASAVAKPQQAAAIGDRLLGPQRLAILGRLVWQHWRQSRRMSLVIMLLLFPLLAASIALLTTLHGYPAWFIVAHAGEIYVPVDQLFFSIQVTLALATVPMFGLCAFLADQRRSSYRFLTDRGVPPKFVWLSRQLLTLGIPMFVFISLLLGLFLLASALLPVPDYSELPRGANYSWIYAGTYTLFYLFVGILGYVFLGISVGQLCSMFFRSPLLAGLFSVLLTIVLNNWCALMLFWRIPWVWSMLPIPLALLLATRLRTADWLVERGGLRAWRRPGLALLVPACALLVAVPLYRVYSIPVVEPGFSPAEFLQPLTPDEQKALGLYERASPILTPRDYSNLVWSSRQGERDLTDDECAWVDANVERIAMAQKASRRRIHNCPTGAAVPEKKGLTELARLLVCSAIVREKEGKLDAALEQYLAALRVASYLRDWYPIPLTWDQRYRTLEERLSESGESIETAVLDRLPRWAARKGQTPERIIAAGRRLEEVASEAASGNGVKLAYLQLQRLLSGDLRALPASRNGTPLPTLTVLWLRLPWERARAERLVNRLTRCQLDDLSRVQEGIRRGEAFRPPACGPNVRDYLLWHETETPYALHAEISLPPVEYNLRWGVKLVQDYIALVAQRRAVRVVLALEAWKLKHGALPKKLDELVGHGLDQLPADPYSGKPFHYFRDGLKTPLHWSQPQFMTAYVSSTAFAHDQGTIAADRPFLWACGNKVRYIDARQRDSAPRHGITDEYEIFAKIGALRDDWRLPDSEFDVWESGWPFAIPVTVHGPG